MLPSVLAKQLRVALGDYVQSTFPITNPVFKDSIQRLIETPGALFHEPFLEVRLPFRVSDSDGTGFSAVRTEYKPYVHQQMAYDRLLGEDGRSTLVATGTGSGKTECFLYPILEYCYSHRSKRGIKALIIYPMNALASDQARRIAELIYDSPQLRGNVTAGIYVGGHQEHAPTSMGEKHIISDHDTLLAAPPHILLTNYKMLDYLLVRPKDAQLWKENGSETLKYIVVDELHTFDGAQGTDLACLLRRLKNRLSIQPGYLCCVGTSATLGGADSKVKIRDYAGKIFGEPFEEGSVITEDRLSPEEFFAGHAVIDYTFPSAADVEGLRKCVAEEDQEAFLLKAATSWLEEPFDQTRLFSDQGRVDLGNHLMDHNFMHILIKVLDGGFGQATRIIEVLLEQFPQLVEYRDPTIVLDSFLALISHARQWDIKGRLQPFLHVQVQIWLRELRRLLAKVSATDVTFALASDLNDQQMKHYLPVINCRDCGETGWVSFGSEQSGSLSIADLEKFYNLYFRQDPRILMVFPRNEKETESLPERKQARLCPGCLKVAEDDGGEGLCRICKNPTLAVWLPRQPDTAGVGGYKRFTCPSCGSEGGISIVGLRAVTAISAILSQLYASHYNDDKKLLAFSDNVQDAAHRAGFFNTRTWNFSLRAAIQQFALDGGAGRSLPQFVTAFLSYWKSKLTREEFVATFIPPNLSWMRAYEKMKQTGNLAWDDDGEVLLNYLERRLEYDVYREFGLESRLGRTLEKSGAATLALDQKSLNSVLPRLLQRLRNEVGELRDLSPAVLERIVAGWLFRLKINGAFDLDVYRAFIASGGKSSLLSNHHMRWLPGVRKTPRFMAPSRTRGNFQFDVPGKSSWYGWWIGKNLELELLVRADLFSDVASILIEELRAGKILTECAGPAGLRVWALNPDTMHVSTQVAQMVCNTCGDRISVAKGDVGYWENSPCLRKVCSGRLKENKQAGLDYFGRLYSAGSVSRIIAHEHTGLLERDERESLEAEFKKDHLKRKPWDANLLSSTPTLEMGIDIGDLSTVALCNIPPGQAQYVQRVGRAGRKDGNSLTIAVANAEPHDLFFYAEPLEMIAGGVQPPDVFLNASAVLERQFLAYCLDCWVKTGVPEQAVPRQLGSCLNKLPAGPVDFFPFNFLHYVQTNLATLYRRFTPMFEDHLSPESLQDLNRFARGVGIKESPMHHRVLECFQSIFAQRESLRKSIKQLRMMIDDLKRKPHDSSFEEELEQLSAERGALARVVQGINNKNVFSFLSEEGLLPNYAFPESGIVLKAVLYRRGGSGEQRGSQRYERLPYEYRRPASAAISEFAPANSFYAGGRKLSIDQIDLSTTQSAKWRLCPNCHYAQLEETGRHVASCPRCGSVGWADSGQVRSLLRVQMVYSEMDYGKSLIGDEERRSTVFYLKQMLVDVEDRDILSAYKVGTDDFPFGYEFVRKATLREINFGENDIMGEKLSIAGREEVRKGFFICKYCGKVQRSNSQSHSMTCRARKKLLNEPFEECLFLYREFQTEALRVLVPSTTMAWSQDRLESFVAAFMLGMRGYFGNVDHLEACVTKVPVPESAFRKQYLVVYDSVPGGTGYLKQLMRQQSGLMDILEKAITIMENCSCKQDPQKQGCYRCLYAYRRSRNIGEISREVALELLKKIVAGKDHIEEIERLDSIPVNSLFESELERLFIQAFEELNGKGWPVEIRKAIVNNKEGFTLLVKDCLWSVEPQVWMDENQGVPERTRVDFVFHPQRSTQKQKPVVVYTDGFQFHKNSVHDDTLKRLAITRRGDYRVWTLTWRDVQEVFRPQGDYCPPTLRPEDTPSGLRIYKPFIENAGAEGLHPDKLGPFELLLEYLGNPGAEDLFLAHAQAYALSILQPGEAGKAESFENWNAAMQPINENALAWLAPLEFGDALFGRWQPRDSHGLSVLAGVSKQEMRNHRESVVSRVVCILDDGLEKDSRFERNWNAFWQFTNMMQFLPAFVPVTKLGLEQEIYAFLAEAEPEEKDADTVVGPWTEIYDNLFDDLAKVIAGELEKAGFPPPSDLGFELTSEKGEIVGEAEMAWATQKLVWLLPHQQIYQPLFEAQGWKVFVGDEVPKSREELGLEA